MEDENKFRTKFIWQEFYSENYFVGVVRSVVRKDDGTAYEYVQIRLGEKLPDGHENIQKTFNIPIATAKLLARPELLAKIFTNFSEAVQHDEF
ncbi:MAG: hypothetical protein QXV17_06465 [Candidatus Micrarchaeaceae archaeon]